MEKELQGLLYQLNQHINTERALTNDLEAMAVLVKNILDYPDAPPGFNMDTSLSRDSVIFSKGFHDDEGGFRWISQEGEMIIPAEKLQFPSLVCFTLKCAAPNCYARFPFDVSIFVDGSEAMPLTFDANNQIQQIQMTVSDVTEDLRVRIKSTEDFVPSQLGGGSIDNRHLSVQLTGFIINQQNTNPSAGQENPELSPDQEIKQETQPTLTEVNQTISADEINSYGENWDVYVRNSEWYAKREPSNKGRTDLVYPGDEWGNPEAWSAFANKFLRPFLPDDFSGIAVEIGQGSGKYTLEVIDKVNQIICLDVSQEFINIAQNRMAQYYEAGKVKFELLKLKDCQEILKILKDENLVSKIDLFFSIDSMVHVELHTLMAYFIIASKCLKMGGHMTMGVASCTNDLGFARLIEEVPYYYGGGKKVSHQFYFLSKEIVYYLTDKLGFEIVVFDEDRDINFVAKKVRDVPIKF